MSSPLHVRDEFPIISHNTRSVNGKTLPFVYLDTAVSAQKPQCVIDAMVQHLTHDYGSIHRGAYGVSIRSSQQYEEARQCVATFVSPLMKAHNVIFVRGATEGLNLLARGLTENLSPDSRLVCSELEHHANMIPWQQAALRHDAELAYIPLAVTPHNTPRLGLDLDAARRLITSNTKVVAVAHSGNVLGQINDIKSLAEMAHAVGATFIVDAAQSLSTLDLDPIALGADAVVFSGHKLYGPSGIGAVVARDEVLARLEPLLFGGGMISEVTLDHSSWAEGPARFEAGTPPITEAVGLKAALAWMNRTGRARIHAHAAALADEFRVGLETLPGVEVYAPATGQETILSFRLKNMHAHDVATYLDHHNIAMRAGHHCAWPLIRKLGVDALVRASFGAYSTTDDVQRALTALEQAAKGL